MLSRIGQCCWYSDKFNRMIIVETDFPGAVNFRDDFGKYFISQDADLHLSAKPFHANFDKLTAFPEVFSGRISAMLTEHNLQLNVIAEVNSSNVPNFDFTRDYAEQILLHEEFGGGLLNAGLALRRMSLSKFVRDEVEKRLAIIGQPYTSIHVRDTDYRTDYQDLLRALKETIAGPIFLATDNRLVVDFCQDLFGSNRIFSFSNLPERAGEALHYQKNNNVELANRDAIADLMLLAGGRKYHYFPIQKNNSQMPKYSGYSVLANYLHKDQKLLKQIIHAEKFSIRAKTELRLAKIRRYCLVKIKSAVITLKRNHPPP
jgi:hypothetical protein